MFGVTNIYLYVDPPLFYLLLIHNVLYYYSLMMCETHTIFPYTYNTKWNDLCNPKIKLHKEANKEFMVKKCSKWMIWALRKSFWLVFERSFLFICNINAWWRGRSSFQKLICLLDVTWEILKLLRLLSHLCLQMFGKGGWEFKYLWIFD